MSGVGEAATQVRTASRLNVARRIGTVQVHKASVKDVLPIRIDKTARLPIWVHVRTSPYFLEGHALSVTETGGILVLPRSHRVPKSAGSLGTKTE